MIQSNISFNSSSKVNSVVELYLGSTLVTTCTCNDRLQDFTVERIGESGKFFGFGVIHKLKINLIDLERNLNITKNNTLKIYLGVDDTFQRVFPTFYVDEIERDENTNTITVVAYDKLYESSTYKFADLSLGDSYYFSDLANACAQTLKVNFITKNFYAVFPKHGR